MHGTILLLVGDVFFVISPKSINMYNFTPLQIIMDHMPEIVNEKVSIKARSPNQFLSQYKKHGKHISSEWTKKRDAFISRTSAAYYKNPTKRRQLALLCWAYTV